MASFTISTRWKSPTILSIRNLPQFLANFGPRNVIETKATTVDDPTTDRAGARLANKRLSMAGPLPPHPNMDPKAKFNMEDVDDELVRRSVDFIDRSAKANKPFFLWHNTTRTHVWTHLGPKWKDKSGYGLYADAIMELDAAVGSIMKKLDDAGIADNTIVVFTSDMAPRPFHWPDGGNSPFPRRKGHDLRGRIPRSDGGEMAQARSSPAASSTISSRAKTFSRRFLAAAGEPDVKGKLLNGMKVGDKTFKTHLDGYNFLPYLKGEVTEGPRKEFFYFTDNGDLTAVRYADWKLSFKTIKGNLFNRHRRITNVPLVTNLRQDPWERYQTEGMLYGRWWGEKLGRWCLP